MNPHLPNQDFEADPDFDSAAYHNWHQPESEQDQEPQNHVLYTAAQQPMSVDDAWANLQQTLQARPAFLGQPRLEPREDMSPDFPEPQNHDATVLPSIEDHDVDMDAEYEVDDEIEMGPGAAHSASRDQRRYDPGSDHESDYLTPPGSATPERSLPPPPQSQSQIQYPNPEDFYRPLGYMPFIPAGQPVFSGQRAGVCTLPCTGCTLLFPSQYYLQTHITTFHDPDKPYECYISGCNCRFPMLGRLQSHIRGHFGLIACQKCARCFMTPQGLTAHKEGRCARE